MTDSKSADDRPAARTRFAKSIRTGRIILVVSSTLSLLLVIAIAILTRRHTILAETRLSASQHSYQILNSSSTLMLNLLHLESSEQALVLFHNRTFFDQMGSDLKKLHAAVKNVAQELTLSPVELSPLKRLIDQRSTQVARVMWALQEEGFHSAREIVQTGRGPRITEAIRERLDAMIVTAESALAHRQQKLSHLHQILKLVGFVCLLLALLVTVVGAICFILQDQIAESQRLKQLESLLASAESAASLKSMFVSTVSHELRTPMTGLTSVVELMEKTRLDADQRDMLSIMKSSVQIMLRLINDILLFSKIESGHFSLVPQIVDLSHFLGVLADTLQPQARAKGLTFMTDYAPDLPRGVRLDGDRLRQVLVNLCDNAFKFTPPGGTVRLLVTRLNPTPSPPRPDIRLDMDVFNSPQTQYWIQFQVTDTGIGIPREKLADIFAPFTQATPSTSQQYGGTGLGLTICSQIVKLMGGHLQVQSELGHGSSFRFMIPCSIVPLSETPTSAGSTFVNAAISPRSSPLHSLAPSTVPPSSLDLEEKAISGQVPTSLHAPASAAAGATRSASTTTTVGLHVLLAEDSEIVQKVMTRMLNSLGHTVTVARNGAEAVDALVDRKTACDVVLMDIQMPVMDGLTATRKIREYEHKTYLAAAEGSPSTGSHLSSSRPSTRLPIFAVTAGVSEAQQKECVSSGMDRCFTKPISLCELEVALSAVPRRSNR